MQCSWWLSIRYHMSSTPYCRKCQQISILDRPTSDLPMCSHGLRWNQNSKVENEKLTKQLRCRKYLAFVEPCPIWDCNLELQIMCEFTDKRSRSQQGYNRILIPTTMEFRFTSHVMTTTSTKQLFDFFLFFRYETKIPENPNRNSIFNYPFKQWKYVDVTIGVIVIYNTVNQVHKMLSSWNGFCNV